MNNFQDYEVVGEFAAYESGIDEGKPHIIQSWMPYKYVDDLDPDNTKDPERQRWCVSLAGEKCVELRSGDKVVVLRKTPTRTREESNLLPQRKL